MFGGFGFLEGLVFSYVQYMFVGWVVVLGGLYGLRFQSSLGVSFGLYRLVFFVCVQNSSLYTVSWVYFVFNYCVFRNWRDKDTEINDFCRGENYSLFGKFIFQKRIGCWFSGGVRG